MRSGTWTERRGLAPARELARRPRASAYRLPALTILLAALTGLPSGGAVAQSPGPVITVPAAGQVLQGQVVVTGSTGSSAFASAELDFAYAGDTASWFPIQLLSEPVEDGALATWDTTQITDGSYMMRLRVFASDGSFQDATTPFEVANYSSPNLATPTPNATQQPSVQIPGPIVVPPSPTSNPPPAPTPTPSAPNPLVLTTDAIYGGLARGAVIAVVSVLIFAVILLRRRP